ncbi:hypothetical protein BGX38DRAFT_1275525 [Terfezia claveryi]|nr:hypothetical protein BGX38DRAFT_1275525 [Terfezia claveryi]
MARNLMGVPMNLIRSKIVQEAADTIQERDGSLTSLTKEEFDRLRSRLRPWSDQRIKDAIDSCIPAPRQELQQGILDMIAEEELNIPNEPEAVIPASPDSEPLGSATPLGVDQLHHGQALPDLGPVVTELGPVQLRPGHEIGMFIDEMPEEVFHAMITKLMKPKPRPKFQIDRSLSRLEMLQNWVNRHNKSQKPSKNSQTKKHRYGHISEREVQDLQSQLDQMKF